MPPEIDVAATEYSRSIPLIRVATLPGQSKAGLGDTGTLPKDVQAPHSSRSVELGIPEMVRGVTPHERRREPA